MFLRTFGGFEKVFVVVRSARGPLEDATPLIDAAEVVAGEMSRSGQVAEARSGITEEDERFFFRYMAPRMPLLFEGDIQKELAPRLTPTDTPPLGRSSTRSPVRWGSPGWRRRSAGSSPACRPMTRRSRMVKGPMGVRTRPPIRAASSTSSPP